MQIEALKSNIDASAKFYKNVMRGQNVSSADIADLIIGDRSGFDDDKSAALDGMLRENGLQAVKAAIIKHLDR